MQLGEQQERLCEHKRRSGADAGYKEQPAAGAIVHLHTCSSFRPLEVPPTRLAAAGATVQLGEQQERLCEHVRAPAHTADCQQQPAAGAIGQLGEQ